LLKLSSIYCNLGGKGELTVLKLCHISKVAGKMRICKNHAIASLQLIHGNCKLHWTYIYLSIYLSFYLSIHLSIYLYLYIYKIYISIYQSIYIYLSVCLSIFIIVNYCLSEYVWNRIHLSPCLSMQTSYLRN